MNKNHHWWDCLFPTNRKKANAEQNQQDQKLGRKQFLQNLIKHAPAFIDRIGHVTYCEDDVDSAEVTGATSLPELLCIHKELWEAGFQNKSLGPSCYGMFRTESIPEMKAEEVFLGNIWGLWTFNITDWEKEKNKGKSGGGYPIYTYLTVYQIILNQYKEILSSNVLSIAQEAEKELKELEKSEF